MGRIQPAHPRASFSLPIAGLIGYRGRPLGVPAMPSLRDIRNRIRSVKNTQQITKAMKMVAAAKLRKAQDAILSARPYADSIDKVLSNLVGKAEGIDHPLMAARPVKRIEILLITSDRGLCGGFNSNLLRRAQRFVIEQQGAGVEVQFTTVGRKGNEFFRKRGGNIRKDWTGVVGKATYDTSRAICEDVVAQFTSGQVDAVYLVFNEFVTVISQKQIVGQLVPLKAEAAPAASAGTSSDYLYEPSQPDVLAALIPKSLAMRVFRALLESNAAEQGARMSAMESATKNASEMISKLTRVYNRTRQAVITKELMEIVSGAEALK